MQVMKRLKAAALLVAAFTLFALCECNTARAITQDSEQFQVGEFHKLSVLYAGFPGTPRERSFVKLLGSAFARVETIELEKLNSTSAESFDVIVADWSERFEEGRFVGPQGFENRLGREFTRPIVMVGAIGGRLPEQTKFNHL